MIFYHLARAGNIDAILNNGVLEPVSYPDLAACEVLKLRGQGVPLDPENFCTCPLPHDRTPVTWLYPVRWYTPMLGPKNAGYFFILNLPSAYEWKRWAVPRILKSGASPHQAKRWVDIKAELYPFGKMFEDAGIPEYVYTDPIPQDMWVSAHDCETGEQVYP